MAQRPGLIAIGSEYQATMDFTDQDGAAVDPDTVAFRTRSPCGIEARYVYGTNTEVERSSAGSYIATVPLSEAGKWLLRWVSTGPIFEAEDFVYVQASCFSDLQGDPDYAP